MKDQVIYSIVIPTYNNSDTLEDLVFRVNAVGNKIDPNHEIILINDGSTDLSWVRLMDLKEKNPDINLKLINMQNNYGQHKATLCGFHFASGQFIITMDDDLQSPPEEIIKLIKEQKNTNASVVYGTYMIKQHSFFRRVGSSIFHRILEIYASFGGEGSSFRLIDRNTIDKICSMKLEYVYIDEILHWFSSNITSVKVDHVERSKGPSNYRIIGLVSLAVKILFNYTTIALKLMIYGGLLSGVVSFLLGSYFIYTKIVYNVPLGFTSTIVAITFSTSIILFCLGIIGIYIRKLYFLSLDKPPFQIREIR